VEPAVYKGSHANDRLSYNEYRWMGREGACSEAGRAQATTSTTPAAAAAASTKIGVTMSDYEYLWGRRCDVKLRALMNRIYYQKRQHIFEFREGLVKVVALLAGTVAFVNVSNAEIIRYCAVAVTASSAASLVFGFGNKVRDSAKRSAEWALLERDIDAAGERSFTEVQLSQWTARCNELEAGEPAPHPALLERAYLLACVSMGSKPSPGSFWNRHRPALVIH
jgi:hypothetical protein